MKFICVAIATVFLFLLQCEAKPLTLYEVELFAVTPEEAINRLKKLVEPYQKRVNIAKEILNKEMENLDKAKNDWDKKYADVANKLQDKITGWENQVKDKTPHESICEKETTAAKAAIANAKKNKSNIINKELLKYVENKAKADKVYRDNSQQYNNLQQQIDGCVGSCKSKHGNEIHLILACVGIGVQEFNLNWKKIDSKLWTEIRDGLPKSVDESITAINTSLDGEKYEEVNNAISEIDGCAMNIPGELVKPHQKQVDDATTALENEKANLNKLLNDEAEYYDAVKKNLQTKIDGYKKEIKDKGELGGNCANEISLTENAISEAVKTQESKINQVHEDHEKNNFLEQINQQYDKNLEQYKKLKNQIDRLLPECKETHKDNINNIINCVDDGIKKFETDWSKIETGAWTELKDLTSKSVDYAIKSLSKSLEDENFTKVSDAILAIDACAAKIPDELVKPHQKQVDEATTELENEKENLNKLLNDEAEHFDAIKKDLQSKIEGYKKEIKDKSELGGNCADEISVAENAISEAGENQETKINQVHEDLENNKFIEQINQQYGKNLEQYQKLKNQIDSLLPECKETHKDNINKIINCVDDGIKKFETDWSEIESDVWIDLKNKTTKAVDYAIESLSKSLEDENFTEVSDAMSAIDECVNNILDQLMETSHKKTDQAITITGTDMANLDQRINTVDTTLSEVKEKLKKTVDVLRKKATDKKVPEGQCAEEISVAQNAIEDT